MTEKGKTQLVIMYTVGPDEVAEGERIFASHGEWMKGHPREGQHGLIRYSVAMGPELENPVDPASAPTGNTVFVLDEVYESPAGIAEHWKQAVSSWQDFGAIVEWAAKAKVSTLHGGAVIQSLR